MKIYKCDICGNMMETLVDADYTPMCHNNYMRLLECSNINPNEHHIDYKLIPITDGVSRVRVCVGKDNLHPFTDKHFIKFIAIKTNKSHYTKFLKNTDRPCASFFITEHEKLLGIYIYCNLHGLFSINLADK